MLLRVSGCCWMLLSVSECLIFLDVGLFVIFFSFHDAVVFLPFSSILFKFFQTFYSSEVKIVK